MTKCYGCNLIKMFIFCICIANSENFSVSYQEVEFKSTAVVWINIEQIFMIVLQYVFMGEKKVSFSRRTIKMFKFQTLFLYI